MMSMSKQDYDKMPSLYQAMYDIYEQSLRRKKTKTIAIPVDPQPPFTDLLHGGKFSYKEKDSKKTKGFGINRYKKDFANEWWPEKFEYGNADCEEVMRPPYQEGDMIGEDTVTGVKLLVEEANDELKAQGKSEMWVWLFFLDAEVDLDEKEIKILEINEKKLAERRRFIEENACPKCGHIEGIQ